MRMPRRAVLASPLLAFVKPEPGAARLVPLQIQLKARVERVEVVVGFCWTDADGNTHTEAADDAP